MREGTASRRRRRGRRRGSGFGGGRRRGLDHRGRRLRRAREEAHEARRAHALRRDDGVDGALEVAAQHVSTSRVMSCEMSSLADGEMSFQAGSSNSYSARLIFASMTRSRFLGSQKGG